MEGLGVRQDAGCVPVEKTQAHQRLLVCFGVSLTQGNVNRGFCLGYDF